MSMTGSSGPSASVLLVDDMPANLMALEAILGGSEVGLVRAQSGPEALQCMQMEDFAVVLLDVQMHGMDGFETAKVIRERPRSRHTPIIFLTAYDSDSQRVEHAYGLGAVDFLVKPIVPKVLRSKVGVFVELFRKTEQIKQQAEELRLLQQKEFDRRFAEARQRWDLERARTEAAQEKRTAAKLAQKADELAKLYEELQAEVAERKRAELERQQLENRIRHAQKLESLCVLAGGIAHDFNNLLTAVLGNVALAQQELPADSAALELLQQAETATLRAADLTRQMLAYSGKGSFSTQAVSLPAVVEEMVGLLRTTISKQADLRLDFAPNMPAIEGDPTQIRQIVMNLIINASEALGNCNGSIIVRTGLRIVDQSFEPTPASGAEVAEGAYVCLELEDTGCGMSEETLARIFDPFFTTKFTGRGLGLAAVLGIVRSHRGLIDVRSTPGEGTLFQVFFPCRLTSSMSAKRSSDEALSSMPVSL